MEFQECSTYVRQDAMVMCLFMNFATHYVYNHVHNGLKLSERKVLHMVIQCPGVSFYSSYVTIPCDNHRVILKFIASIVMVLIPMHGDRWLA